MRKLVRDFLVKQDYDVLEAGDGEEAVEIFYDKKDIGLLRNSCCWNAKRSLSTTY